MDRIEWLKKYLEKSPEDSFSLHALALEYISASRIPEAIELWNRLLSYHPDYLGAYLHLGKALEASGDEDQAVHIYERGISIAGQQGEGKARAELQQALDELI